MIYLIGGAPRIGKSIIAKKIAESTQSSLVSTDDICEQVIKRLAENERKIKFPLPGFSGKASENVLTADERVKLQLISAESLQPEMGRIISEAIMKRISLVVEGVHILPKHVRGLMAEYGAEQICPLFVGLSNVDRVVDGIVKNNSSHNWMRDSNPDVIRQVAEFVAAFSVSIREETLRNGLHYEERTDDFENDIERLANFFISKKPTIM